MTPDSFQIDENSSGTQTITVSQPNDLSGVRLIRNPVDPSDRVPFASKHQTHYFQFTLFNPIPANGVAIVTLTTQQIDVTTDGVGSLSIRQVNSSGVQTSTSYPFTATTSQLTITLSPCQCSTGQTIRFNLLGARAPSSNRLPTTKIRVQTQTQQILGTRYRIDFTQNDFIIPVTLGPLSQPTLNRLEAGTNNESDKVGQIVDLVSTWYPQNNVGMNGFFVLKFSSTFLYEQEGGNRRLSCSAGVTGSLTNGVDCLIVTSTTAEAKYNQRIVYQLRVSLPGAITVDNPGNPHSQQYTVIVRNVQNPFHVNQAKSGTITLQTMQSDQSFVNASFLTPPTSHLPALNPGTLTLTSITRSVRTVDADTQLDFSITTANKLVSGHSVIFKIPRPLFEISSSGCTGSCTFTNDQIQIIATNLICSAGFPCAGGSTATFRANVKNAYNIASQVGPFTIQTTTQNIANIVDQFRSSSYNPTPNLQQSAINVNSFTIQDRIVGEVTNLTINFTLNSKVLSGDFVQVAFSTSAADSTPPKIVKNQANTSCTKIISATNAQSSIASCQISTQGGSTFITSFKANSFCSPLQCNSGESFSIRLNRVKVLGFATTISPRITVNSKSSDSINIGRGTRDQSGIIIQPNSFSATSVKIATQNCGKIYETCSIELTATPKNPIPLDGKVQFIFPTSTADPAHLNISPSTVCTSSSVDDNSSLVTSCAFDALSTNTLVITHSQSDIVRKIIKVEVNNVQLATSTQPVNFIIRSLTASNQEIDRTDNVALQALPGSTTGNQITRSVTRIRQPSQYVFKFTTTNNIDSAYKDGVNFAAVKVILPQEAEADFTSALNPCIVQVNRTLKAAAQSVISTSTNTLTITNICLTASACGAGTSFQVTCPTTVIKNKDWKNLTPNQKTDSIQMGLSTPNFLYWLDAAGQFAKPELEPGTLTVNSLTRSGNSVNELVILGSNVTPGYSDHIATGMLVFVINRGLFLDPNQAIQSKSGSTTKTTTIKQRESTNPSEIELLRIIQPCGSGVTCPLNQPIAYNVEFLKNPLIAVNIPSDRMEIYTATERGYQLDRGYSLPLNQIFQPLTAAQFSSVKIRPEDPTISRDTAYDFIIKVRSDLPSTSFLDLALPSTLQINNSTCNDLFDASNTSMTCSVVINSSGTSVLRIQSIISSTTAPPPSLANGYFGLKVRTIRNPSTAQSPGKMTAWLQIPAGIIAQGQFDMPTLKNPVSDNQCNKQCRTCSGSPSFCTSCTRPGTLPFNDGETSTCLSQCSSKQFLNPIDNKCYECDDTCQTCFGYSNKHCLSCKKGLFKSDGECVANCPAKTKVSVVNNKNVCENIESPNDCSSPCLRCSTSLSYCLTCNTQSAIDTIDPFNGKCVASSPTNQCPDGSYSFQFTTSYKQCSKCYYLCGTCQERANKCLSCLPNLYIESKHNAQLFTCTADCQSGQYLSPRGCAGCNKICKECYGNSPANCNSCNQNIISGPLFLSDGQCVTQCLSPKMENIQSFICESSPPFQILKSIPLLIEVPCLILTIIIVLISLCINGNRNIASRWWNGLYALISLIIFINRFLLLLSLFKRSYPVQFAVCFTLLFVTIALGLMFHVLYFKSLIYSSSHFNQIYQKSKCGLRTVVFFTYLGGQNVMRLLSSGLLGAKALSNQFGADQFWRYPLEMMGWYSVGLCLAEILLGIVVCIRVALLSDGFICAILGLIWSICIIYLQTSTWFLMKKRKGKD